MIRFLLTFIFLTFTRMGFAHGEGVYTCALSLVESFSPSDATPIPPAVRIVTAHYETDDIGVLAWWGPHNTDPQHNVRIDSVGRGENAIYREFGLSWKTALPELILRPSGENWDRGTIYWNFSLLSSAY